MTDIPPADDMFIWDMWLSSYRLAAMTVAEEIGVFRTLKAAYSIAKFTKLASQQFSFTELFDILSEVAFKEISVKPTFGYFNDKRL